MSSNGIQRYPETDQLERRLTHLGNAIRRQHLLRGLVIAIVQAIVGLAVIFAFDYLFRPPFFLRPALLVLLAGWMVYRFVTKALTPAGIPLDAEEVSVIAERRFPELQSRLVSTLQFQGMHAVPTGTSANLVDGMIHQAFERSRGLRWRAIIDRSWWKRWGPWLLFSLALAAAVPLAVPTYATAFAQRLIDPAAEYPTRTVIEGVTGIEDVAEGDPIALAATVSGVRPPLGRAVLSGEDGSLSIELAPEGEGGAYRGELPPLTTSAELIVEIGDDVWGPVELAPVPRVRVAEIAIVAQPPAYTGMGETVVDGGSARLPMNSEVALRLRTSKPVESISLVPARTEEAAEPPALRPAGDDGRLWEASFTLHESMALSLEAVDIDGLHLREPPTWRITAVPDRPPRIRLRKPSGSVELAPVSQAPLAFSVQDDYGLREVAIKYVVVGLDGVEGPTRQYPLPRPVAGAVYEVESAIWDNRETDARPGEQVRLWVEAVDNAPEPHQERSSEAAISVITAAEYKAKLFERLGRPASELGEMIPELKGSQRNVKDLIDDE